MAELDANVIVMSMYAQCDLDGNQYLLLDSCVDYRKKDTASPLSEQKIVVNGRKSLRRSKTVG